MQREYVYKGRTLGTSSDLTLLAPLKAGLVDSLESVTYKTRTRRVLEALHGARGAAHEQSPARLLSDTVERVGVIHSVRVAVLEPEDKVLLAVTFDGSWEAYIRVLWDKVGTLLDLVFCGTEGYVTAWDHSFADWLDWAHRVQVETDFFYGPPDTTARDLLYSRRVERLRARGGSDLDALRATQPGAEQVVDRFNGLRPAPDDPPLALPQPVRMLRERLRNGLQGLAGLYRLADLHRPGTADGAVLRRAALQLLLEFVRQRDATLIEEPLDEMRRTRFARQIDWLFPPGSGPVELRRRLPPPAASLGAVAAAVRAEAQGGILRSYESTTHGLVALVAFVDASAARDALAHLGARLTVDAASHDLSDGSVACNVAFTPTGLRACGLDEDTIELFPQEFRQGMAARAGLLGDLRDNHPRRWRLPRRFAGIDRPPAEDQPVELDAVHALVQWRCQASGAAVLDLVHPSHPLRAPLLALMQAAPGLAVLAVQPLRRRVQQVDGRPEVVEHFGFADGFGQPQVEPALPRHDRNRVHLGELLHGHDNGADLSDDEADPALPAARRERLRWLRNGSFLVVRKYRQYVGRLDRAVEATARTMAQTLDGDATRWPRYRELVRGKLMGRGSDGMALVLPPGTPPERRNHFDYQRDPHGLACPLHAHIRRAHPRAVAQGAARVPRLMRRGMSYGPDHAPAEGEDEADRGLLFMAYNADLGQQFEVVQQWLAGGNSTDGSSLPSCPIVGPAEAGQARVFSFEHAAQVFRIELEPVTMVFDEPQPITRLEWGLYLFAPSRPVLQRLHGAAATAATSTATPVPWQVERGRRLIQALQRIEIERGPAEAGQAWKAALEDPQAIDRLDSAAIWAALRSDHGGLLRTPYGTLVGSRHWLDHVLRDDRRYSVCGQLERIRRSFGEIYLVMDDGPAYVQQATAVNDAIGRLQLADVYRLALDSTTAKIDAIVDEAKRQSRDAGDTRFDVAFEARELTEHVLADLCEDWFGLRDGAHFARGSTDWFWQEGQRPLYPGHFTALSRYMFQPNPGPVPVELGQRYGRALRRAMLDFVAAHRAAGTLPLRRDGSAPAPLAQAIFQHPVHGADDDFVARTMVGVLMGFNPTIIGALHNVLREWQHDGRFGALRTRLAGATSLADAQRVLAEPMAAAARMRPMPQLTWRTVLEPHRLGDAGRGVELHTGDKLVLALVSGTQQSQADGGYDGRLMFGGARSVKPHPTHACPGYAAGIGAMLGTLAALLARRENLRPGTATLSYLLDGRIEPPAAGTAPMVAATGAPAVHVAAPLRHRCVVLGWGDSWLDYRVPNTPIALGTDLRDCLQTHHDFDAPQDFCNFERWTKAANLAANPGSFCDHLSNELQLSRRPRAILLSGGGNDCTGATLEAVILPRGAATVLDAAKLGALMDALQAHYRSVLQSLAQVWTDLGEDPVPVVLHGYDYPIPTANPIGRRWLYEPFFKRGYDCADAADQTIARGAMRQVIDAFNTRLAGLAQPASGFGFVHHERLAGTIEAQFTQPLDAWGNDLHPTSEGFALLAAKLALKIDSLP